MTERKRKYSKEEWADHRRSYQREYMKDYRKNVRKPKEPVVSSPSVEIYNQKEVYFPPNFDVTNIYISCHFLFRIPMADAIEDSNFLKDMETISGFQSYILALGGDHSIPQNMLNLLIKLTWALFHKRLEDSRRTYRTKALEEYKMYIK